MRYVNDSKATNVAAALRALASFPDERLHVILGGRGKHESYAPLAAAFRPGDRAYLIGEAADEIAAALGAAGVPFVVAGDLETALRAGRRGRVSPATSSSSRRRARASTSSATSRLGATRSASSWRRCAEGRRLRGPAPRRVPHARSRRVRARDGLQRDLRLGGARERRPDELPQAAGRLRVHRRRLHDAGGALRLPPPALPRPAARSRRARPLCRRARPRAGDQRCAALVHRRPRELPALRAREARALPLRRDLPRAPARAADVRRAHEAARRCSR